ncbi:restriction endonuclease [Rhizobium sp.]|uniref:restriction endonuclease n=1 Tax=Rhizobium sp. TaxID=391 RepID=UPI0028A10E36
MLQVKKKVPGYPEFIWPVVSAFRALGGSADKEQLLEKIAEIMQLPEEIMAERHGSGPQSEVGYRVAWVQTWLKHAEMLENPKRGVWLLTPLGRSASQEEAENIQGKKKSSPKPSEPDPIDTAVLEEEESWQTELINTLKAMPADAFERLTRLLLLQLGFSHVEVVGRSGDGGIDCIGLVKVNSVLSFKVLVQCKRYKATVGPGDIRDFRGAMQGRTDKALFVTTGRFTGEAKKESSRDGVPAIDLIDGEAFATLLKDIQLGVKTEMVEKVSVMKEFFADI